MVENSARPIDAGVLVAGDAIGSADRSMRKLAGADRYCRHLRRVTARTARD